MKRLLPDRSIRIGEATLTVVARHSIDAECSTDTCWLYATKEPYAVVIQDAQGVRAMDMLGQPLSSDGVSDMEAVLNRVREGFQRKQT